ncbi:MAG TPA: MFS transporter [Bacteroidales bacterium]|nr:MFS transporter [Bacteroidales bacterium]
MIDKYNKKLIFRVCCAGILMFGIAVLILGSVATDLRSKLDLDEIQAGTLFSILPVGMLTGSLLFGPVADKYGYRILLSVSCIFLFAGFEGIAYVRDADILKLFIFLIGLGGGAVNGATSALVADISDTDKGASLSLLGAFFGLGALGIPLILGILRNVYSFEAIVAGVGTLALVTGICFLVISYPPPKQKHGFPVKIIPVLVSDKVLLMIAFFLFFQSSFEGIINNWTTTWLKDHLSVQPGKALFALSAFVAGMTVMRLLLGSLLRPVSFKTIMKISFILIFISLVLLRLAGSLSAAVPGLVLLGAGLAAGFPMMLGIAGERFKELSGTAFSFVMSVALTGNILINYLMGVIADRFGIASLITVAFIELMMQILIFILIIGSLKKNNS